MVSVLATDVIVYMYISSDRTFVTNHIGHVMVNALAPGVIDHTTDYKIHKMPSESEGYNATKILLPMLKCYLNCGFHELFRVYKEKLTYIFEWKSVMEIH